MLKLSKKERLDLAVTAHHAKIVMLRHIVQRNLTLLDDFDELSGFDVFIEHIRILDTGLKGKVNEIQAAVSIQSGEFHESTPVYKGMYMVQAEVQDNGEIRPVGLGNFLEDLKKDLAEFKTKHGIKGTSVERFNDGTI